MSVKMLAAHEVKIENESLGTLQLKVINGDDVAVYSGVEVRLAFPMSKGSGVVSFRQSGGKEIGLLRESEMLDPPSGKALKQAIELTYFIPEIEQILSIREEYGVTRWKVITDRGPRTFDVTSRHDIRLVSDGRYIIRDIDGNRYEIRDASTLDVKSLARLEFEI